MVKKQFLKTDKKKSKHTPQVPVTADEFLAAGVDFEEAGEKWRGGDAAKSTRFFVRAIDTYDEGIRKFPSSFDLAYNKARVQYEITQYPKLLAQFPGTSLLDLLSTALESSRYALNLRPDNADVLFNTAQVLTSIVEAISETRNVGNDDNVSLLEEAIELFQKCLALQEQQYSEAQARANTTFLTQESPGEETLQAESSSISVSDSQSPTQEDQWATIIDEPVTLDTLLDTLLALLQTLTTLCSLTNNQTQNLTSWIEKYSTPLLSHNLPNYLDNTTDNSRKQEAFLIKANFTCALADANFRLQRIDLNTYQQLLESAYSDPILNLDSSPEGLCSKAEAYITYNTSMRLHPSPSTTQTPEILLASRWKVLTAALASLTQATKLPSADNWNLPKIHLLRGDTELLRYQLGQAPWEYEVARKNGNVLLKNAGTFYRGAAVLAAGNEGLGREGDEAGVKEGLVVGLGGGGNEKLMELIRMKAEVVRGVLEDAVEDGLVSYEVLGKMGIA